MEMIPHDQFVVRNDWCSQTHSEKQRLYWVDLRLYNQMWASIDTKAFQGSSGNLSSPREVSVDHEYPDSLYKVGEHSNISSTGEPSEVEKEHIPVSKVPTNNRVNLK